MLRNVYVLLFTVSVVYGKVFISEPIHDLHSQFKFIDRFCFDEQGGELKMQFEESDATPKGQQILIYHDVGDHFPAIYESGNSCQYKRELAAGKTLTGDKTNKDYFVHSVRPRWWYIVLANCESKQEIIDLRSFNITYLNNGGHYSAHFGKDEENIYETEIFACISLLFIMGLFGFSFFKSRKETSNTISKVHILMFFVCATEFFAVVLMLAHRSAYSSDGIGNQSLEDAALFVQLTADVIFTSILIFISKGWQISSRRLEEGALRSVVELLVVYMASCIALYVWSFRDIDPVLVPSLYQSPPGTVLCVLRAVLLLWFLSNLAFTYRNERANAKKNFYVGYFFFGVFHFLTLPTVAVVASLTVTWHKKKAVTITDLVLTVLTYVIMWLIFGLFGQTYLKKDDTMADMHLAASDDMQAMDERDIDTIDIGIGARGSDGVNVDDIDFAPVALHTESKETNDDDDSSDDDDDDDKDKDNADVSSSSDSDSNAEE